MTVSELFHYTTSGALLGLVGAKKFWASKIQHMNDDQEYVKYLTFVRRIVDREFSVDDPSEAAFRDEVFEIVEALKSVNIFSASFTENGDLLSQWRGYCPYGGYSVGFNKSLLQECTIRQGLRFEKCIYTDPKSEPVKDLLEKSFRNHKNTPEGSSQRRSALADIERHILDTAPIYKDVGFAEEAEWRVFSPPLEWSDKRLKVVDIRGRLRPIIEIDAPTDSGELTLDTVYVSPGPDRELRREAAMLLLKSKSAAYRSIKFATVPYNNR